MAADTVRLKDLEQAVRQYLAWHSICDEKEALNLDAFQSSQAKTKCDQSDETINTRISEAFNWLLVSTQPDPQGPIEWQEIRLQGQNGLTIKAGKKLINEENLITQFSGIRLRLELDNYLWKDKDHLNLKMLWEYFATYLYLPRLKNSEVLVQAIQDSVGQLTWRDYFAYAEGWDEEKNRYLGLKAGQTTSVILSSESLIVKPDVAQRQLDADREKTETVSPTSVTAEEGKAPADEEQEPLEPPEPSLPRRFHGSVKLDSSRLGRDAGKIAEEIVQHLSTLQGAQVEIILEIQAQIPDGVPENIVRIVLENCSTLKFDQRDFETD